MSTVKTINSWFRTATRADVNKLLNEIILSERQARIFDMFYLKKQSICFIADKLCCSPTVISEELSHIRRKICVIIQ